MGLSVRTWLELVATIAAVVGVLWWRHALIADGEAIRGAADTKARQEQHDADARENADTIQGLRGDQARLLAQLNAPRPNPPTDLRVVSGGGMRVTAHQLRPGSAPSPAQSCLPANGGLDSGLPGGGGGGDVGPGVRDIALAGELLADYRQRLWDLEVKETANGRSHPAGGSAR